MYNVWCQEKFRGQDYSSPYIVRTMNKHDNAWDYAIIKERQAAKKSQAVTHTYYVTPVRFVIPVVISEDTTSNVKLNDNMFGESWAALDCY